MRSVFIAILASTALWTTPFAGAATPPTDERPVDINSAIIVTQDAAKIGGRDVKYVARAGRLPIRDAQTGTTHGYMFFVSYSRTDVRRAPLRPVMFLWNGGPGADSSLLHLHAFGPKTLAARGIVDNRYSLLPEADLVFVDAIGTGFSRVADPRYETEFFSVLGTTPRRPNSSARTVRCTANARRRFICWARVTEPGEFTESLTDWNGGGDTLPA